MPPALRHGNATQRGIAWVAENELYLLLMAAPFFIIQTNWWWLGAVALLVAWVCRRLAAGRWTARTPLDVPFLLIVASTPLAFWASVDRAYAGLLILRTLFGIAVVYAIANRVRSERGIWWAMNSLVVVGVGVSLLAIVGMESPWQKMFALPGVYSLLPHAVHRLSEGNDLFYQRPGYHPNTIGGVLAMLIPLGVGLWSSPARSLRWRRAYRPTVGAATLLMAVLLALTQSRTAWVALAAALALMAFRPRRRWLIVVPIAVLTLGAVLFLRRSSPQFAFLVTGGRGTVWAQAAALIKMYPLTGKGLDPYPLVAELHVPYYLLFRNPVILAIAPADRLWVHAHNFWLQTWLDFGLLGLLGALALFVAWVGMAVDLLVRDRGSTSVPWQRALVASFLAFAVFGLADGPFLYRKMTLVLWPVLGLTICAHRQAIGERGMSFWAFRGSARERRAMAIAVAVMGLLLIPFAASLVAANIGYVEYHRSVLAPDGTAPPPRSSEAWLRLAVRLSPSRASLWRGLARVQTAVGDRSAAEVSFQFTGARPG